MDGSPNWLDVVTRLLRGDRVAFAELNRLVTGLLIRHKVYDLRDEWDDLRQEVIVAVVTAAQSGSLREPDSLVAFVRSVTRNKVADRLGERYRTHETRGTPWEEVSDELVDASSVDADDALGAAALWSAVADLPAEEQAAVRGVYGSGKTYDAVSAEMGIPLGTMKRRLRVALAKLREHFAERPPENDPTGVRRETTSKGRAAR